MRPGGTIRWPDRFRPERVPVHVRNEADIEARPERVWSWLIRASGWATWYPNSRDVRLSDGARDLGPGVEFRWKTFGASLVSRVEEFEAPSRLAWSARGIGVDVYHAWLLEARGEGTHVLTEESQYGALARLDHVFRPNRMSQGHALWLRNLEVAARGGPPP